VVDVMRIALISDVHGNLHAFEKVVEDIRREKVDSVAFLGDLVFLGLYPQACFDLLMTLEPMCFIKGNTDANLEELASFTPASDGDRRLKQYILHTDSRLNEAAKDRLSLGRIAKRLKILSHEFIFCHGSPYSFKDQLEPDNPVFPEISQRIATEHPDAIFCGHIHQPMRFQIGSTLVFNPGAVGYSFDGDVRASYGIVTIGDSVTCSVRRVEYDVERYKREVMEQEPAFMDLLQHLLQTGRPFRGA
jgi:putative phosphoesterase